MFWFNGTLFLAHQFFWCTFLKPPSPAAPLGFYLCHLQIQLILIYRYLMSSFGPSTEPNEEHSPNLTNRLLSLEYLNFYPVRYNLRGIPCHSGSWINSSWSTVCFLKILEYFPAYCWQKWNQLMWFAVFFVSIRCLRAADRPEHSKPSPQIVPQQHDGDSVRLSVISESSRQVRQLAPASV